MPTYIDTSAVLRVVESLGDTTKIDAALLDAPLTSSLTELECWAALHKRWHDGELREERRDEQLAGTARLLSTLDMMPLDAEVLSEARNLTRLRPLRTLDGLHVATAVVASRVLRARGQALRFCTADRRQADAAQRQFGADQVDLVPPWR